MKKLMYFEISSKNPKRATWFCEDIIGVIESAPKSFLESNQYDNKISNEHGPVGGLDINKIPNTTNITDTSNLDEYINKKLNNGGTKKSPKGQILGIGLLTYFGDVEGNIFGIIEMEI
ncbi:MAG: hypothetical protein PHZ26_00250 [Candidatus Gracilibacteria bacterium]|nr:hypothetical protein [Candidatus Gracilibacteria bacterium]MDD2908167.1 hypothetical protein [Candidatus Gracilibacteria bacterium]